MCKRFLSVTAGLVTITLPSLQPALADVGPDTSDLRQAVTVDGVRQHQAAFQAIADANGGVRAADTPGYDESADYVANVMQNAGYQVTIQPFDYPFFQEFSPAVLEQLDPTPTVYPYLDVSGFVTMTHSGSGDVTAVAEAVDVIFPAPTEANTSTSGCEPQDFAGFTAGNIAILQRGSCTFLTKALNAQAAGATGVVIFNEGSPARTDAVVGTLVAPATVNIPVVGTAFAVGEELAAGGVTVHMFVNAISEFRSSYNVLADSSGGRSDRVVVVGAHLDSVPAGPGIQDNGSGSAAILEIAVQMAELQLTPRNQVRFAWWGAEEPGLLGSQFYVDNLSKREIKDIALYLNFDMIGSPNFVLFVYDGDGSSSPLPGGPRGSGRIEQVFADYFADQGLPFEEVPWPWVSSDHLSFAGAGIPIGGLFTGAQGIKTEGQAAVYGGTAGVAYDPCYHLACDTFDNISLEALDQMADAAAHAVMTFAMSTSAVKGTAQASSVAAEAVEK